MGEALLLETSCRWCGQSFHVCQSCWRGQGYCSKVCRIKGYRRNRQNRQRKYRQSEKGKKTHCRNENKRKKRLASKKVGDAPSNIISSLIFSSSNRYSNSPCCHFCGQKGRIVAKFPRRRYGRSPERCSANPF